MEKSEIQMFFLLFSQRKRARDNAKKLPKIIQTLKKATRTTPLKN